MNKLNYTKIIYLINKKKIAGFAPIDYYKINLKIHQHIPLLNWLTL